MYNSKMAIETTEPQEVYLFVQSKTAIETTEPQKVCTFLYKSRMAIETNRTAEGTIRYSLVHVIVVLGGAGVGDEDTYIRDGTRANECTWMFCKVRAARVQ